MMNLLIKPMFLKKSMHLTFNESTEKILILHDLALLVHLIVIITDMKNIVYKTKSHLQNM